MPSTPDRMPAFFVGHGSPMNAIEDNRWSRALRDLAALYCLPILYVAAAADERDEVSFPIEGFDWGSLSMRSVVFRAHANRTL